MDMSSAQPQRSSNVLVARIARIFTLLGVVLLVLAAGFALQERLATRSLLRSIAVVSENVATQDAMGAVSYASRLRFRLSSGESVVLDDPQHSDDASDPDYVTGAIVPVAYPAGHPEQARIATSWHLYHRAWVVGIIGTILFDLGLILRLILKRIRA
jgi:hypothetical protein